MSKLLEVRVNKWVFPAFARVTRDGNPLHTDSRYAVGEGFKDTPAQGVFLQAQFERALYLADKRVATDYRFKFENPVYDGDNLSFELARKGEDTLDIDCFNQDRTRVGIVKAGFFPKGDLETPTSDNVFSGNYDLDIERVNEFYDLIEQEREERVPLTLVSSLIPSALLDISSRGGTIQGRYSSMTMNLFNNPRLGDFDVNIFTRTPRERGGLHIYPFRGDVHQNGRPIVSAGIMVFSPEDLKL